MDFPEGVEGSATKTDNAVLTAAAERLRERHPEMFKPSAKCHAHSPPPLRLQPCVPEAAALRAWGCSPVCLRLQPCVPEAAAPRA